MDPEIIVPASSTHATLFPAYVSDNQSKEGVSKTPLFPAYSSDVQGKEDKSDKDWLCNSSFTPENYVEAVIEHVKNEESQVLTQEVKSYDSGEKKDKKHKKKKSLKKKKEKEKKIACSSSYDPSAYVVSEEDSIRSHLNKKTFIGETGLSLERAFRSDNRCDPENIFYDCFDKKDIAKYILRFEFPFGVSLDEQKLWSLILPKKKEKNVLRYFNKKTMKTLQNLDSKENVCLIKEVFPSDAQDYVPLTSPSKSTASLKQGVTKVNFDGVSVDWKAILSQSKTEEKINDKNILEQLPQSDLQVKTIMYNRKLAESPNDVQLWLNFVNFQDELCNFDNSFSEKAILEKKVAILDKALSHNPKSIQLNIARLNLYQNFNKTDKIIALWENLIFLYPNSPQVWQGYLLFVLSNLTYFNTSRVLKLYAKCFRTLSDLSEGIIQTHEPPPDVMLVILDILNQLCYILNSCGYTEKAIAIFQAVTEFNILCDQSMLVLSVSEQISCFEPFWDSGAPRVGEDEAVGWAVTVSEKKISSSKIVAESDLNHSEDEILLKKLPLWETWLEFERLREIHHWLPWKPNPLYDQTSDDIDDIDRTISFDDVSKFLFRISDEKHKFVLLKYFVEFLGYNAHLLGCNTVVDKTECIQLNIENYRVLSKVLSEEIFSKHSSNPFCFQTHNWTKDKFCFVNNIFSQTLEKFGPEYKILLSFMWLRFRKQYLHEFKSKENINEYRQFAKSMLKKSENRNCLLLWFEYIQVEWLLSGSKAKNMHETLLVSSSRAISSGSIASRDIWYFIQSYIQFYVLEQENSWNGTITEIIWILTQFSCREKFTLYSNQPIKPTLLLKSVSGFKNFLEKEFCLSSENNSLCYCVDPCSYASLDCAKCYAYLQYFSQGFEAALDVCRSFTENIEMKMMGLQKRCMLEQMSVFQAELMNFHTWKTAVGIKPFQNYLYDSIQKHPNNSRLLCFLLKLRNASCVVSTTRRFFNQLLKESNKHHHVTWIFALASELSIFYQIKEQKYFEKEQLLLFDNPALCWGINWKIQSLYEKIVQSELYTHIPILWRSFMKYEIMIGNTGKAKEVFHRAMQNCGWSRELLLDGIECFPDDMKQILDFMAEKQIRIHTPLEEVTLLMEYGIQDS